MNDEFWKAFAEGRILTGRKHISEDGKAAIVFTYYIDNVNEPIEKTLLLENIGDTYKDLWFSRINTIHEYVGNAEVPEIWFKYHFPGVVVYF